MIAHKLLMCKHKRFTLMVTLKLLKTRMHHFEYHFIILTSQDQGYVSNKKVFLFS